MENMVQPSDDFWAKAVENSPEGLAIALIAIVAILFVVVKWGLPWYKDMRANDRELEKYKIDQENAREKRYLDVMERNIAAQERQTAAQEHSNSVSEGLVTQTATLIALLQDSKEHSAEMGSAVHQTHELTVDTHGLVEGMSTKLNEVHRIVTSK